LDIFNNMGPILFGCFVQTAGTKKEAGACGPSPSSARVVRAPYAAYAA
jgi:hypothetical protein